MLLAAREVSMGEGMGWAVSAPVEVGQVIFASAQTRLMTEF